MAAKQVRGPGRLTAEATAQLADRLLDAAQAVFLEQGYARSTIDAIARRAEVTRKTLYARYADKRALFDAVIDRLRATPAGPAGAAKPSGDARATLLALAGRLAATAQTPLAVGLGRILYAEAHRSPELRQVLSDLQARSTAEVQQTLEALSADGALPRMPEPALAASLFMELVISEARSRALLGVSFPPAQLVRRTEAAVDLFLRGCGHGPP
jgi:AcrR family transcriptional regulator